MISPDLSRTLNALALLVISGILTAAFIDQIANFDLPCPLCLLQRVGFVAVGFGLCLNLVYGPRPQHYGIMIVSAIIGGSASVRQILLHIVPGTGSYGEPFLGLHFYTWAALAFFCITLGAAVMLSLERQVSDPARTPGGLAGRPLAKLAIAVILLVSAGNAVSALLECGPGVCADNPTGYELLDEAEEEVDRMEQAQ